jgi:hypothetical protein
MREPFASCLHSKEGTETSQSTSEEEDESNINEKMIDLPSFNPKNSTPKDKTSLLPSKDKHIPDSFLSILKGGNPEHTGIIDASETEIQKDSNSKDFLPQSWTFIMIIARRKTLALKTITGKATPYYLHLFVLMKPLIPALLQINPSLILGWRRM